MHFLIALLAMGAVPAFEIERLQLANGLTVILAPDRGTPDIALRLAYRAATADEPANRSGLARVVARLGYEKAGRIDSPGKLIADLMSGQTPDMPADTLAALRADRF